MRALLSALMFLHGLIHLMGFAKSFRYAELPQLKVPIAPWMGVLWLVAAVLFVVAAAGVSVAPRWWWAVALVAVTASTVAIVPSWSDAKAGALVNVVVAAIATAAFFMAGPRSLRAEYDRDVGRHLAVDAASALVSENDLAKLPEPVRRYLRLAGTVGQPRVWNVRVRMHGRMRQDAQSRWMSFTSEQLNTFEPSARLFYMEARLFGLPVAGYHRYVGSDATMRVKAAGVVPVVTAGGDEMARAETVTLFNDMCVMAPATLIDPAIEWELLDERSVRATFAHEGHRIGAELVFNAAGELVNFRSDDRLRNAGTPSATRARWSTPMGQYRAFGPFRLSGAAEARWQMPDGEFAYMEASIDDVTYNHTPQS